MTADSAFDYRGGRLYAEETDLIDLVSSVGTPCYIYSRRRILDNLARLRSAFPQAEIHYSLKANANLAIIRELIAAGASLDAVSGGEIYRAIQAGAAPERIVFAGVGKTEAELTYALEVGVGWFNVESGPELERLARIAQGMSKRTRVALRLNPDIRADTHHYIATGHAATKFGIPLADASLLLDRYAHSAYISIEGLHVHIGSQLGNVQRSVEAAQSVLPLFDAYPALHTLDLGGGFPVSYNGEPVSPVEAFAGALTPCFADRSLHLLLEPGRYIIADAGLLIVEVQYIKTVPEGTVIVTDGGMTELIRPALYGAIHNVVPLREVDSTERLRTYIVGPVCESADVLRADILFPPLQPGALLAITHVGAYGAVMGSNYNARPRPPEILVNGATWQIIRRRETWQDMIALEQQ